MDVAPVGQPGRPAPRLWLVRHARPIVEPGICYGALDVRADPGATLAAAQRLAAALPASATVCHSTLQRCEQLAADLKALRPELPQTPDPRLREMDFGLWEGRAWESIGKADIDAWTAAFATHRPGDGESLGQMLTRVHAALTAARTLHLAQGFHDVVWITHAGVARCVAWLQERGTAVQPSSDAWPVTAPAWGAWEIRSLGAEPRG